MNIIEKVKAGHPYAFDKSPFGLEEVQGIVTLKPEPSPGEVLTEEWARYYINVDMELEIHHQHSRTDKPVWAKSDSKYPYNWQCDYRLPLPTPKMRNIYPEELPVFFGIVYHDGVIESCSREEIIKNKTINHNATHANQW